MAKRTQVQARRPVEVDAQPLCWSEDCQETLLVSSLTSNGEGIQGWRRAEESGARMKLVEERQREGSSGVEMAEAYHQILSPPHA